MTGQKQIGRPMKYDFMIRALDDQECYTPAAIVRFANTLEDLPTLDKADAQRARISLGRFRSNHQFPDEGDGWVKLPGQPLVRGWTGRRWKEALPEKRVMPRGELPKETE